MNIDPRIEILRIGERRYRVCALDERSINGNVQGDDQARKNRVRDEYTYSKGGWKNVDEETIVRIPEQEDAQSEERRQARAQEQRAQEQRKQALAEKEQQKRAEVTHFVAVRFAAPLLTDAIEQYRKAIPDAHRFDAYYQSANRAHVTLLVLRAADPARAEKAQQVLKRIRPKFLHLLKNEPATKVSIKGANFFGKSRDKARVVYLDIEKRDGYEFLKSLADLVIKSFLNDGGEEAGAPPAKDLDHARYNDQTKMFELDQMHLTLFKSDTLFDASDILDAFKDFQVKGYQPVSLDLCRRGEYD